MHCGGSIGVAISCATTKSEVSLVSLAVLTSTVPALFAGVFRSVGQLPPALQWIKHFIPLSHLCNAMGFIELRSVTDDNYNPGSGSDNSLLLTDQQREQFITSRTNFFKQNGILPSSSSSRYDVETKSYIADPSENLMLLYFLIAPVVIALGFRAMGCALLKMNGRTKVT